MSLLIALLIGASMGVATGYVFKRNGDYMLIDLTLGIAGSVLGMCINFLAHLDSSIGLFSVSGTLASVVGAAIFLVVYQLVLKVPKQKQKNIEHH